MFYGRGQDTMDYALLLQEKQKSESRLYSRITQLEAALKTAKESIVILKNSLSKTDQNCYPIYERSPENSAAIEAGNLALAKIDEVLNG